MTRGCLAAWAGDSALLMHVLNVQPVAPLNSGEDWMLINRPILPVIYQPALAPGVGDEWGIGDLSYQAYLSPRSEGEFVWGTPAEKRPASDGASSRRLP